MKQINLNYRRGVLGLGLIAGIAVIALVAIIVFGILDIGKLYNLPEVPSIIPDRQVQDLEKLNDSDEVSVIEQDLNDTNIDQLDKESSDLDKAINDL